VFSDRLIRLEAKGDPIMVRYLRSLVAISALAIATPLFAHADSILLGSYGTSASNPGVLNTSVSYDPTASAVDTKSNSTYNISPGSIWHAALPNSSYVSFNPNTAPVAPLLLLTATMSIPSPSFSPRPKRQVWAP